MSVSFHQFMINSSIHHRAWVYLTRGRALRRHAERSRLRGDHELNDRDENIHNAWDSSLEPVLTIEPGEVVRFECHDAPDRQVTPDWDVEDLANASFDPVHPLTGPVKIVGAESGDALVVELLDFEHKGWGFTRFMPREMDWASSRSSRRPASTSGSSRTGS